MKRLMLLQKVAALVLAIMWAPDVASAQVDGTVTISGSFRMDYLYGELDLYYFDPDLYADLITVFDHGQEHTWTLTLHGTTQSHFATEIDSVELVQDTDIRATSFDLEFFGPDAATLNGIVSDHLSGEHVWVLLRNHYSYYTANDYAVMHIVVGGGDGELYFSTTQSNGPLFPADAQGYPEVRREPFAIEADYTELGYSDMLSGTGGAMGSLGGLVTIAGSVGQPPPALPRLVIHDGSVLEGNRGTTNLKLTVTLSASSTSTVTVAYATANGTAQAKSDYIAASGKLTFQPGQTSRTISIAVQGDRKREPNETFYVQLSNPAGATIDDGVATGTILNDD